MTTFKRFTQFAFGHDNVAPEVWVNPSTIAYVSPRIITRGHAETVDGTLLYFQQEAGVLAVREPIAEVVDALSGASWRRCVEADPARYGIGVKP